MYIPKKIKQLYPYLREALTPSDAAWRFSVWAILWFWLLTFFLVAWPLLIEEFSIWKLLGFLTFYSAIMISAAVAYLLIHLLTRLPTRFVFALILPLPLLLLLFVEFGQTAGIAIFVGGLLCLIVVRGTAGTLCTHGLNPRVQKFTLGLMAVALIGISALVFLSFVRYEDPNPALSDYKLPDHTLPLPDPSEPGEYDVLFTTYGSGTDRYRSEFGENVGFQSRSVDGSRL